MPPPLLFDFESVDTSQVILTRDQIYETLPHRYEFMVLDGVCMFERDERRLVAYVDVKPEDWWVRGHLPNRPLLPGAIMLEMAGQASAVTASLLGDFDGFLGFGGVDACKFRDTVVPPARLYLLCVGQEYRPRRIISVVQGVRDGKLVFEAKITGVIIH